MSMDKEGILETALVIAFFTLIIFLGPATASEHRLSHDYPVGYGASDSYQHQTRAQAIYDTGDYRKEAPYMMVGLKDITGFYPPIMYHDTILLSRLSGLATYDSLLLLVGLGLALGAAIMYYLTRGINKAVAALALPLTLFVATGRPFLGAVTFGQMPFALSSLFLTATAWAITKAGLKKSYILIGIALAGSVMTHTSEMLFLIMFIGAFFAAVLARRIITEKLKAVKSVITENKEIAAGLGLAAAITLYFWPLFIGIWMKMQPYPGIKVETESASFPAATVHLWQEFGTFTVPLTQAKIPLMAIFIMLGLITTIIIAIQKRKELGKLLYNTKLFPLAFSAYMLLAGFGTYLGFGLRSFQTRLFWPITLAPLAGFGIYQIVKPITAAIGKKSSIFYVAAAVSLLLSGVVLANFYEKPYTGSMTQNHWEAMKWIAENAPPEAKVWVMYSHAYSQTSVLYNTKHVNYFLDGSEAVNTIREINEKGKAGRMRQISIAADSGAGLPYRTGLLSFGQHAADTVMSGKFDVCSSDYYLIDTAFGENDRALQQLNQYFIQNFAASNMTAEYQNNWLVVMKNNNAGGECLAA